MGAPKLPKEQVRTWLRQGLGNVEIVALLAAPPYGITVAPTAISNFRRRAGMPPMKKPRSDLLPWRVAIPDQDKFPAQMLRCESRVRSGEELEDPWKTWHQNWMKKLEVDQLVVDYDREDGGWKYRHRTPEDTDIIRMPVLQDQ